MILISWATLLQTNGLLLSSTLLPFTYETYKEGFATIRLHAFVQFIQASLNGFGSCRIFRHAPSQINVHKIHASISKPMAETWENLGQEREN